MFEGAAEPAAEGTAPWPPRGLGRAPSGTSRSCRRRCDARSRCRSPTSPAAACGSPARIASPSRRARVLERARSTSRAAARRTSVTRPRSARRPCGPSSRASECARSGRRQRLTPLANRQIGRTTPGSGRQRGAGSGTTRSRTAALARDSGSQTSARSWVRTTIWRCAASSIRRLAKWRRCSGAKPSVGSSVTIGSFAFEQAISARKRASATARSSPVESALRLRVDAGDAGAHLRLSARAVAVEVDGEVGEAERVEDSARSRSRMASVTTGSVSSRCLLYAVVSRHGGRGRGARPRRGGRARRGCHRGAPRDGAARGVRAPRRRARASSQGRRACAGALRPLHALRRGRAGPAGPGAGGRSGASAPAARRRRGARRPRGNR